MLHKLRCESQLNPLGIDTPNPRLSWKLDDAQRGARQTAYRILAASSPDKLAQDQGDLWDSGKIISEQSHLVPYVGNSLSSGQIVHWKVKVWDNDSKESVWSEPAHFEMGMLDQNDWKAQWITNDRVLVNNDVTEEWVRYVLLKNKAPESEDGSPFRDNVAAASVLGKDFVLEHVPERARVYVSAKGFYELFLNGQRISDEERNHVPTTTGDRDELLQKSFYVVYDVTPLLRQGENHLRCVLWAGFNQWQTWGKVSNKTKGPTKFFLQLDGANGGRMETLVVTDDTWRQMTSPILKSAASPASYSVEGEVYDARISDPCRGDTSLMTAACPPVKTTTGLPLCWRYMPPERVIRRVKPVRVFSPCSDLYIFDLGEIITGNIELSIPDDLSVGDRIVFRYSPELQTTPAGNPNPTIMRDVLWYPEHLQAEDRSQFIAYKAGSAGFSSDTTLCDIYVMGDQRPKAWRTTQQNNVFRYVEVIGLKKPPQPGDLTGLVIHSDLPPVGRFECSEPAFNRCHELCVNTTLTTCHGIMVDNWDRERNWYNHNWNRCEFAHYVLQGIDFLTRFKTEGNASVVRAEGMAGWTAWEMAPIKDCDSAHVPGSLVYEPWQNWEFEGDRSVVEQNFDAFLTHLRTYAKKLDENGHFDADEPWGDWTNYPQEQSGQWLVAQSDEVKKLWSRKKTAAFIWPKSSTSERTFLANAVLCDMARRVAVFAAEFGREEERQEMQALHEKMKAGLNKVYFKEEALSYAAHPDVAPNGSDSLDAYAFYADIVPEALREKIARRMVAELKKRDCMMTVGVASLGPYVRLLADYGFAEEAYAMYAREEKYGIKHMMRISPDGVPEAFYVDNLFDSTNARVQGCLCSLGTWFWYGLGGLRTDPAHPGMKHFTLAPQIPTKMAWAKIDHESPYGKIVSSWKREGDRVRWEVTVPPNSTATALIPAATASDICEGGKPLQKTGLATVPGDNGTTKVELKSGSYVFDFVQMAPRETPVKK